MNCFRLITSSRSVLKFGLWSRILKLILYKNLWQWLYHLTRILFYFKLTMSLRKINFTAKMFFSLPNYYHFLNREDAHM